MDDEDSITRRASSSFPALVKELRVEFRGLLCLCALGVEVTVMLVLMVTLVDREMAGIIIRLFGYFLCLVPVLLDIKKSFSSTVALIELTNAAQHTTASA